MSRPSRFSTFFEKSCEAWVAISLGRLLGPPNLASEMATHASQLYSKNVENLLGLITAEDGSLDVDLDDEVVAGACITHAGEIRNERAREVAEGAGS